MAHEHYAQFKRFEQNIHTGKIAVVFDLINANGRTVASVTSGSVFSNTDDAQHGARRALFVYTDIGMFPNMCEPF